MSGNGKPPLPFQAPAGTPLVGQPFTLLTIGVPMNMTLTCNCLQGAADPERPVLTILMSAPVTCPACGKQYNAVFNPQNGQIQMNVGLPQAEQVPS